MVVQSPSTVMKSYTLDISNLCQTYNKIREHARHKLLDDDIQRRKDKLVTVDQEKAKIIHDIETPKSSKSRAPNDADIDLNARPITDRDLSGILNISSSNLNSD